MSDRFNKLNENEERMKTSTFVHSHGVALTDDVFFRKKIHGEEEKGKRKD